MSGMTNHPFERLSPETVVVAAGRPPRAPDAPLAHPVTFASTYVQGGPWGYARYGNPGTEAFEEVIAALEGGYSLAFASGLAAVSAVLDLVPTGAVVVAPSVAYSGARTQFAQREQAGRIVVRRIDPTDPEALAAEAPGAALVWLESPTNPLLDVVDLTEAVRVARAAGAITAVDATFATPLRIQPLLHPVSADLSVHSATKLISGHSDVLLGVVSGTDPHLVGRLRATRTYGGAVAGAMETWLALRGLRTLSVRLERAEASTRVLRERLVEHPVVERVRYPGFGTMLSIELADASTADAVVDAMQLWVPATSLGGVESTLERRRRWPEESPAVPEGLLRLSVGIEAVEDLWRDLERGLDLVSARPWPHGS
jgi:cystathionine gamma-synthase